SVLYVTHKAYLTIKVKKDIKNKRRGHQSEGVILHHDNARPHTAAQMVQTTNKLGWELLPHPSYSPDFAPSDFHLFGPLKALFMRGTKFESDDEVKSIVSDWLRHQSKDFYAGGLWKLVHRWEKCVTLPGDYVDLKKFFKRLSVLEVLVPKKSPNLLNDPRNTVLARI
uniref:Histone-lysine N-methyltransferase SETMAR n=1 Tax=Hippocampus comes TaxID=109280 RepID=A0A3Q2XZY3_HIPCM